MKRRANIKPTRLESAPAKKRRGPAARDVGANADDGLQFTRLCQFSVGDKVIGFFGGWPYAAIVLRIESVVMTYGIVYAIFVRWSGFSGKNATGWTAECDLVPHNAEGLAIKQRMETLQREKLQQAKKTNQVQYKKVFMQIVREVRGSQLAPLQMHTAPYPEEWQFVVRFTSMPRSLVDCLVGCESLVYERRLTFGCTHTTEGSSKAKTVLDVLEAWEATQPESAEYAKAMRALFNRHLIPVLMYKFEIPLIMKQVAYANTNNIDYASCMPVNYVLRLLNILPQLITASVVGLLNNNNGTVSQLLRFCSSNQSFMSYLSKHKDELLTDYMRECTTDQPAAEHRWSDMYMKDSSNQEEEDNGELQSGQNCCVPRGAKNQRIWKSKRKNPSPLFKPAALDELKS